MCQGMACSYQLCSICIVRWKYVVDVLAQSNRLAQVRFAASAGKLTWGEASPWQRPSWPVASNNPTVLWPPIFQDSKKGQYSC